jgi:inosine-uridine nucleoside N-ribohydrolase
MGLTKTLVDCDPGHDDAVALLFAARHCELLAVTTVYGNAPLARTTRNALAVLELAGVEVAVAAGAADALVHRTIAAADIHGKSGLDGHDLPEPRRAPVPEHAVDVLIELASAHRGELVVAPIGPLTNIALALKREPRLAKWVREFSIMGGSTTLGNITPAAEFNIYADPEAAHVVFESGVPIRMAGYNVTRVTGFDAADIARLRGAGTRVGAAMADHMAHYLRRQGEVFGLDVAPMHDVCAIVPYLDESLLTYRETSVKVELNGVHTRGMTVCDMRGMRSGSTATIAQAAKPNARVAVASDARRLIGHVLDAILTYR